MFHLCNSIGLGSMIRNALSFVAVVKAGSFSIAAQKIGVSKAQLSRHVSQLEEALGIQLLYRTTRSLVLTESGEQFFQSCCTIEESYTDAVDNIKRGFHAMRGTLRITAPISFGTESLPKFINQFTQRYPNINVILSLSSVTEDLIEQNFDLAIRVASTLPDSTLRMRTMMEFEMALCASPIYFKNQKPPVNPEELKKYRCISSINRNREIQKIQWAFIVNDNIVKYTPNSVIEVDSMRAQIELVMLGAGIGRAPKFLIENELKEGKLIEVLPNIKQPKFYVYLLYPDRKNLPKKTQVFIDFMREVSATLFSNAVVTYPEKCL